MADYTYVGVFEKGKDGLIRLTDLSEQFTYLFLPGPIVMSSDGYLYAVLNPVAVGDPGGKIIKMDVNGNVLAVYANPMLSNIRGMCFSDGWSYSANN